MGDTESRCWCDLPICVAGAESKGGRLRLGEVRPYGFAFIDQGIIEYQFLRVFDSQGKESAWSRACD
jgi:hypothetical protein